MESIRSKLQTVPLPIQVRAFSKNTCMCEYFLLQYPLGVGKEFTGVCDLVTMDIIKWNEMDGSYDREAVETSLNLSQDLLSEIKQARSKIVDEVI